MAEKTRIKFFGVKAAPYPGAARDGVKNPSDPEAVGWHVVVGGVSCGFDTTADFAKHFGDFLQHAYDAGVADTKADLRERLGL